MDELKRHSATYFLAQMVPAIASLAGISLYIRLAGADIYGQYAVILSLIMLVQALCSTWLSQSVLRYRTENSFTGYSEAFVTALKVAQTVLVVVVGVVVTALYWLGIGEVPFTTYLLGFLVVSLYISYSIKGVETSSRLRSRRVLMAEWVRSLGTLLVSVLGLTLVPDQGVNMLLLGVGCGLLAGYLILSHPRTTMAAGRSADVRVMLRKFLYYGMPLSLWMAFFQLHNVSDRFQISFFLGAVATAEYSAIYDIVYKVYGFALVPVLSAAHPIIMNSWNSGKRGSAIRTIASSLKLQIIISLGALCVLVLVKEPLVAFLLGHGSADATGVVIPVAVGAIAWQFAMVVQKILEVNNRIPVMVVLIAFSLSLNVIGNYLLIPLFGYVAAAYTTLASGLTYLALAVLLAKAESKRSIRAPISGG